MENYRTDEEQVEALKRWWEKNGKYAIIFAILVIAGIASGRVWMNYKQEKSANASAEYDTMMQEMQSGDSVSAMRRGAELMEHYKDSPYADLTALAVAKMEVEKGDLSSAALRLKWVIDHPNLDNIDHVARLRLIRVLIEENKLDEALGFANFADTGEFKPEYDLLKGDIYVAKGQRDLARTAYQAAMNAEGLSPQTTNELRLKLDSVGGASS